MHRLAGDKASLAIGMAGLVGDHLYARPIARGVAAGPPKPMALIESIGDPTLTVAAVRGGDRRQAAKPASSPTCCDGRNRVIDLADGDPAKGNLHSSGRRWRLRLATAWLSPDGPWAEPGWRDDLRSRPSPWPACADPMSYAAVVNYVILRRRLPCGVLLARRCSVARDRGGAAGRANGQPTMSRWASRGSRWASRSCIAPPTAERERGLELLDAGPRHVPAMRSTT